MRKLLCSLLLLFVAVDVCADPLMVDLHKVKPRDVAPAEFGRAFAVCDAERLLVTRVLPSHSIDFGTITRPAYAYPDLVPVGFQMQLIPNGVDKTDDGRVLALTAAYSLSRSVVLAPGVAIIEVSQMINAVPPGAVAGMGFKFVGAVNPSLALIERIAGVRLQPRLNGSPTASQNVWFSVDQVTHTAWCWRRLPSAH